MALGAGDAIPRQHLLSGAFRWTPAIRDAGFLTSFALQCMLVRALSLPAAAVAGEPGWASSWPRLVELPALLERVHRHAFWGEHLRTVLSPGSEVGLHLAVFIEPFLSDVLSGRKSLESRFSRFRIPPFGGICSGDVMLIKQASGPICGVALAQRTWCFDLSALPIETLRERFAIGIRASDRFWDDNRNAMFATIIQLAEPIEFAPLSCRKRDRRGWVTLRSRQSQLSLW